MKTAEESIEELAQNVTSFKELKAIVFSQDMVYKNILLPAFARLPSDIRDDRLKMFNHFFRTYKNMIGYLWKEGVRMKQIIEELSNDEETCKKIEEIQSNLSDSTEESDER